MTALAWLQLVGALALAAALVVLLRGTCGRGPCCRTVIVSMLVVGTAGFGLDLLEHRGGEVPAWVDPYSDAVATLWPVAWFALLYGFVLDRHRRSIEHRNQRLTEALEELRQAQECLARDERLRAIGEMAAGIAHDFNNRLTMVLSSAELLRASGLGPREQELCDEILRAGEDAAEVVRRMQDFARPDQGVVFERVDVRELLEGCVALTRPRWRQRRDGGSGRIDVEVHVDGRPDFVGSERELANAVTNLLFNAVDALPEGGHIDLTGRVSDDCVVLEVVDDGLGMTDEVRAAACEPFFTTKPGDRGTGLGLSIVRTVAESHGGRVEIDSAPGRGTTVRLVLPRVTLARNVPPLVADGPAEGALHVLVVDDNEHVRLLLRRTLERSGHRVLEAADGAAAYEVLLSESVDVVLLDRVMPGVGGDEAARQIKDMCPGVPVVLMTGYGGLVRDDGFLPPGVDATLEKPIAYSTLMGTLAAVCRRRAVERSG